MTYRKNIRHWVATLCCLFSLLLGLTDSILAHKEDGKGEGGIKSPAENLLNQVGFDQRLDDQLPLATEFVDETGKLVQLREYFGSKPVIILPIYYRCSMLCSLGADEMVRTLKQLPLVMGRDYTVVTLSIDPTEKPTDAAEFKKGYVTKYGKPGAEEGWRFLTGKHEAIDTLTKAIGFRYAYDKKTKEYAHPDGLVIATPEGKIARYFYRLNYPVRDVNFGLLEASKERIGSPLTYIALSCFHYNPETGQYNFSVMKALRVFSAGFVVLCLSIVGVAIIREKRAGQRGETEIKVGEVPIVEAGKSRRGASL